MAGTFNRGKFIVADGSLDWTADTIRVLLVDATYTFDPDDNFVADITGELTDGSYARQTLANKGVTEDDTNDRAVATADPADFGALTNETPEAIVVFKLVTNDADSPLLSFHDDGFGVVANGSGYVVRWEGAGFDEVLILDDCVTSP